MKIFQKFMSLILVIAMMCSFAFAAPVFTDQAAIDNTTAVAVLNELDILTGYTDGSFKPEGILTRAEGAAIITRLLLGDKAEDQMAAGKVFSDVAATDWHAGYVAYCASEGIIAGYGNGAFGPNDTLMVAQFGKMLLTALGYEAAREGFVGADWATPVGKYINKLGLAEGANTTLNAACSREVAAQMALNTLKATMVEYATGSTTIKGEGIEVTVGGSAATKVENNAANETLIDDNYMQFAEQYFPLLRYNGSNNNNFGRPAVNAWSLRGVELGIEASEVDLLKTFVGTVTRGQMYELVGKKVAKDANTSVTVYVDGKAATVDAIFDDANALKNDGILVNGVSLTGNGVITEVYMEETALGHDITIVIINTYVAKAMADYDEDEEYFDIEVYGIAANESISTEDFDCSTYTEDDFLLVTVDNGEVASITPAKSVSGTVTTFSKSSTDYLNSITLDGKKYAYSKTQVDSGEGCATDVNTNFRGTDITLVLDSCGYVITFAEAESVANYLYLTEVVPESTFTGSKQNYLGAVYFTDGTYDELAIAKIDNETTSLNSAEAGWYSYALNADGKYLLKSVSSSKKTGTKVEGGEIAFYNGFKANTKTVFIVVDEEGESTVFTGYKKMSDVSAIDLVINVIENKDNSFAEFVFITSTNEVTITGAIKDNSTVVYIYRDLFGMSVGENDEEFYTNEYALVNGVKATLETTEEYGVGLYIGVEYDNVTGYISKMTKVDGSNFTDKAVDEDGDSLEAFYLEATADTIVYDGGILDIDGHPYDIADNCKIVLHEGNVYTTVSMTKMISEAEDVAATFSGIVDTEGQVTALFVKI